MEFNMTYTKFNSFRWSYDSFLKEKRVNITCLFNKREINNSTVNLLNKKHTS